jgi:hypothetical protein
MACPKRKKTPMRKKIKYQKSKNLNFNNNFHLKIYRFLNENYRIDNHKKQNFLNKKYK